MSLRSRVFPWAFFWLCTLSLMLWWYGSAADRASRQYLESAELRWEKEDYIGAIRDYEKIVEEYPQSEVVSEANYWRGVVYFLHLDKNQKAITSFKASIRDAVSPSDKAHALEAYLYIAEIYEKKLNQPKKAIAVYEKVMEISPDPNQVLEVQYKVGALYFDLGDLEQARVEWDILARKDPKNKWAPVALYREGGIYFILGKCDEAIEIYQTLYTEYPEHEMSPFAKFRAANCYEENQKHTKALQLYRELEGVYPNKEILTGKINKLKILAQSS